MKRSFSANYPFTLFLLAALLAVCACSWAIWRVSVSDQIQSLRESRFQFSINTIRSTLESGLKLGFATADLPGAQALIDEGKNNDRAIMSIDIFDPEGITLFTTDESSGGPPTKSRKACLDNPSLAVMHFQDNGSAIACAVVLNSYQQISAGILIHSQLVSQAGIKDDLPDNWLPLLTLLALLTTTGCVAGWWAIRPTERIFQATGKALAGQLPTHDDDLVGPVAGALRQLDRIQEQLRAAEAEATRIDRMESH